MFDKKGNFRTQEEKIDGPGEIESYTAQVIVANKKFTELIDALLLKSKIPPVIILQSDEGPIPKRFRKDKENFIWEDATPDELRKKFGILNAYYVPGIDKEIFYPGITPVNSFRIIFNHLFGTDFELLPDEIYAQRRYEFINVTDQLK